MPQTRAGHSVAIDLLKGVTTLFVILIHCKLVEGTFVHEHVIDHAVNLFLVLFGLTAELWWSRRDGGPVAAAWGDWYRARLLRLMPGIAASAGLWWAVALTLRPEARRGLGWLDFIASLVGYSPWRGITWFVTLILLWVLVFPIVRWVAARLGFVATIACAAYVSVLCIWDSLDIMAVAQHWIGRDADGGFYFGIFLPWSSWLVMCGWLLARTTRGKVPAGILGATVAAALWAAAVAAIPATRGPAEDVIGGALRVRILTTVADSPLALLLLYLMSLCEKWPRAIAPLVRLGGASWGVYLGQALLHDCVHMFGAWPETRGWPLRLAYGVFLLGGSLALTHAGAWLRTRWRTS
ncbi:MAG TPA: acyltransferase family protein [Polyangiales bacterium]